MAKIYLHDLIDKQPAIHEIGKLVIDYDEDYLYVRLSKTNEIIFATTIQPELNGFISACRILFESYTGYDIDIAYQNQIDLYNHTYVVDEADD